MGVKDFGKHKYRIEMGDGYIQDMFAVQNDTDSRVYEFQIFTAEGALSSATGLSLKLAVDSGDGKVIICDGVLTDSSNAIFTATLTTSQLLSSGKKKAQVMLIEGTKNLRSKTFIIDVGVSLFEGGQYGHNVIFDFEKISNTISRLDDIESSFIANATNKINEFNVDAESKKSTLENIQSDVVAKQADINQTKELINSVKIDFDNKKSDFDNKYDGVLNIVNSENERVEAENLRQQHDERIQSLLNDGLNSELGEYVKKENIVDDLTTGGTNKVLSAEQGKLLFQSVSSGKQLVASAITDKGVQTDATAEFSVMAENIRRIQSGSSGTNDDNMFLKNDIIQYSEGALGWLDEIYNSPYSMWQINHQELFDHSGNINVEMLSNVMMSLGNYIFDIKNQIEEIKNALERFSNGEIVFDKSRMMAGTYKPLDWLTSFIRTAMPAD
ncbi:MAG: hypothetical protein SO435_06780 [Peptostreptococcus porci]|nr:hypothetical protein [Peptostreptococcus porci]